MLLYLFKQSTEVPDYTKLELPSSLQSLCSYVESTLKPQEKAMSFMIEKEVFGIDRNTFVLHEDITQFAGMEEIGATVVAVYMRFVLIKYSFDTLLYVEKKKHSWFQFIYLGACLII